MSLEAICPRPRETNLIKHCEGARLSALVAQCYLARMTCIELQCCDESPLILWLSPESFGCLVHSSNSLQAFAVVDMNLGVCTHFTRRSRVILVPLDGIHLCSLLDQI